MVFSILFLIPALVALGFFLFTKRLITLKEFLAQLAAQAVIAGISTALIYWSDTTDTEVWNGRIVSKKSERVSCSHSYPCNCRTECSGSGKNQSCSTVCDTCYEHPYDMEWHAYTSNNENIEIDTVDRQGLIEPPRWTGIVIGEPSAIEHRYTNYIKAAPDTLFRRDGAYEKYAIPAHPKTYDYYRIPRIVSVGVSIPDINRLNEALSSINSDLGAKKQVNIILVMVLNQPMEWFYALEQKWIGGKKNEVIVVVSVDQSSTIQWANVMAWTQKEMVKIAIRDDITSIRKLQSVGDWTTAITKIGVDVDTHYLRKPMADFEYLKSSITPTQTEWIVSIIIGLLVAVGLGVFMMSNDVFDEEWKTRRSR